MLLDQTWLTEWTDRLRRLPGHRVLAIYLRGSHAQGTATRFSDVDFDVLVDEGPHKSYPVWLVPHEGRLRHVSVAVADVASFQREIASPAKWSFGWPVRSALHPLWIDDSRPELAVHELTNPQGEPLLEDAVEDFSKICSALAQNNNMGVRIAAADLAKEIPTLLRLVNPPQIVANRAQAWNAVLSMPMKPDGFADDMATCLGWTHAHPAQVAAAAHRLLRGAITLIQPHAQAFADAGDLADALGDGRLDQYVQQLAGEAMG
jgi:phosphoribosyl-AMP cyclohydrolase